MATQKKYSQEFKNDAVEYRKSHAELSLKTCAANLGVSRVSLREWINDLRKILNYFYIV